jgi:hypothetical protein
MTLDNKNDIIKDSNHCMRRKIIHKSIHFINLAAFIKIIYHSRPEPWIGLKDVPGTRQLIANTSDILPSHVTLMSGYMKIRD